MRRFVILIFGLLSAVSCLIEIVDVPSVESDDSELVQVDLAFEVPDETKSSVPMNGPTLNNLNVFVFGDGVLVDQVYVTRSSSQVALKLPRNRTYNLYAIANVGEQKISAYEINFVNDFQYFIKGLSDLSSGLPMVCIYKNLRVNTYAMSLKLRMERQVARIRLSVDPNSLLHGLRVESVRLCQSASVIYPFRWYGRGGSRVLSEHETFDGDFASSTDLGILNSGGEVELYAMENCQGVLLPGNTDPFLKVPQMLDGYEKLCTYLELSCSFDGSGIFAGRVDYRIYLGLDDCTSFDVPGNSSIAVKLKLTGEGLNKVSWKVTADVAVMDGYVNGMVQESMHTVDDLYVGEKLLYEVTLAEELMEYLGGDVSGCYLSLRKDGEEVDCIHSDILTVEDNVLQSEISCTAPGAGELYLYSPRGMCLGCLEEIVQVKVPDIVISEATCCEVNGSPARIYLYLVDNQGRNLNSDASYGFDASLFDFQCNDIYVYGESLEGISGECVLNTDGSAGSALANVSIYCENSGLSHSHNVLLSDLINNDEDISVEVRETNFDMHCTAYCQLDIPQVNLTLVDNGWAQYHDCQLSMIVDNPSNLPLEISLWQLVRTMSKTSAADKDYVEKNLVLERIQYVTGEFNDSKMPVYASHTSFCSERNDFGDEAVEEGLSLVYPLDGIVTNDILRAVYYDKLGFQTMAHVVDVTLDGGKIDSEDLVIHDNVSDGSAGYEYLYYDDDSWNYAGVQLFSKGQAVNSLQNWLGDYPYVSAYSLDRMYDRYRSGQILDLSFDYDPDSERVFMWDTTSGGPADLNLSSKFEGEVEGYVKTYPKGTWYSSQDNYCSVSLNDVVSGIRLKSDGSKACADDGVLFGAMDKIYAFTYKDSPKPLGADAYQHRAHPTKMYLTVSVHTEDDAKNELYPVTFDWKFNSIDYYHQQDNKNYKCSVSADYEAFNLVVVTHR